MTLVNRVSAYFLTALAVVLAICSGLFYGIVRGQVVRQFDQQLHGSLHALAAAIEVEPEEAKWQPTEHVIGIGSGDGPEEIRWVVIGDGDLVESSRSASAPFITEAKQLAMDATATITEAATPKLPDWRFLRQRLAAEAPLAANRELDEFDAIVVVVGRSTAKLDADLARLASLAVLLPLGGWLAAAAVGRWFCRRALEPVLTMARDARAIGGGDFQSRLPVSAGGDELTGLGVAFNTALDRLQRSYDAQRRFTGDAAHELRTPLTVLLGQIDVALRKPRSAEEYRGTLELLQDEAGELQQILQSLLFLARADGDALPPESEPIELGQWLRTYAERWRDDPRAADVRIYDAARATAVVSPPLLTRLADNLVGNALKYSAPGTAVVVALSAGGDQVELSVADQGVGIAPADLPHVFGPFFRAQSARTSGASGAGLGLAIAASIAEALHGSLRCESQLGRGTTFTLFLPVAKECDSPGT